MKARKKKQAAMPNTTAPETPKWTQEAQAHFHENGFYRTSDLQRLLGDPGTSVSSVATSDPSVNHVWKRST